MVCFVAFVCACEGVGVGQLWEGAADPLWGHGEVVVEVDSVYACAPVAVCGGVECVVVYEWSEGFEAAVHAGVGSAGGFYELGDGHLEGDPADSGRDDVD